MIFRIPWVFLADLNPLNQFDPPACKLCVCPPFAGDLPQHLQIMFKILRSEDRIKLVSKKNTIYQNLFFFRTWYTLLIWVQRRRTEEVIDTCTDEFLSCFRPYAWRAVGQTGCVTWWSSTPTEIKTLKKILFLGWTSQKRTGMSNVC